MGLGTIAFKKEVYNLDYMTSNELEELSQKIEQGKNKTKKDIKNLK